MKQYKPRDKVTQKITREGAVEENQTTGKSENISGKEKEADFSGRLHFTEEDRAMRNGSSRTMTAMWTVFTVSWVNMKIWTS